MTTQAARELALSLSPLDRADRAERIAQLEPALAREVERLLAQLDTDTAASEARTDPTPNVPLADQLGPFRLLERLGHGGMGTVWLAEQQSPRRRVALKTIRPELLNDRLRERFAHEARFLAALNHPAIAQIHAAGSSPSPAGETPWLAMEFVEGEELLEAARQRGLDLPQKLALLIAITEGVQHAHTRGVMHRDLKPGNILIDRATGAPKILDFGIARAIDSAGPVATRLTRIGEVVGTVQYMSPEQLAGHPEAIDLRSDVYALGVLGYELLAGSLPHAVEQLSLIEAIQTISEKPPKPLSAVRPELAGDVETVIMKALAAEPAARYQSAQALADDLANVLAHRPIRARPPGTWYLFGKFVRRNRALVGAAVVALLALVAATILSMLAADRARAARDEAQARAEELKAVNDFVTDMLTSADPEAGGGEALPLSQVLEGAERTLASFAGKPRTAGQVALLLGRTWGGLGDSTRALTLLAQAQQWQRAGFGAESGEAFEADLAHAEELGRKGELEAAAAALKTLLERAARLDPPDPDRRARSAGAYAQVVQALGDAGAAINVLRQAEAEYLAATAEPVPDTLDGIRYNLAYALLFAGDFKEAEARFRAVVADETARLGAGHAQTLYSIKGLGQALHRQGRLDEAIVYYQQVHSERLQLYGPTHPATLNAAGQVASALNTLKRPAEAEPILRATIAAREARGEQQHPQMAAELNMLATAVELQGRRDEALVLIERAIATDGGHPNQETLAGRNILGSLQTRAGRLEDCERTFTDLLARAPALLGAEHINNAVFLSNAAACDLARGNKTRARERLQTALPILEQRFGPEHARTREAQERLAAASAP